MAKVIVKTGKVGRKYDLYPPKEIREALDLKRGQKVIYRLEGDKLTVKPLPTIEEAEKMPKFAKTTVEEFEGFTKELQVKTYGKLEGKVE